MKKASFLIIFAALFFTTSCISNFKSTATFDKKIDFTQFKTFSMLPWNPLTSSDVEESTRTKLLTAVKSEMESRGYVYQQSGGDLSIGVSILVEESGETRVSGGVNQNVGFGMFGYYGTYGMGYTGAPSYNTVWYNEGAIFIDVFDEKQKLLLWQGAGFDRLEDSPYKNEQKIPTYVKHIFYKYPVKAKRS